MTRLEYLKKLSEEHARFRETPQWLLFRKYMLASHNQTCDFCGKKYKRTQNLDVHHKYETNYTNLDPSRFMLLCKTCHQFIHKKRRTPCFGMLSELRD